MTAAVVIRLQPSPQFLADVMVTVIESRGPFASWTSVRSVEGPGQFEGIEAPYLSVRFDYDTKDDVEGGRSGRAKLTLARLVVGISRVFSAEVNVHSELKGRLLQAVLDNDAGLVDDQLSDIVAQAAILGDVIYG